MNVKVPISSGGERTGEPQYTTSAWNELSVAERRRYLEEIAHPKRGVQFVFSRDEALRLQKGGLFNGRQIGGYIDRLLGVTTKTLVDTDSDTVVRLLGQFEQIGAHPLPNDTIVGTLLPRIFTGNFTRVMNVETGSINQ